MTDDDHPELDDALPDLGDDPQKDDLPGQPTLANRRKRIAKRQEWEEYKRGKISKRWQRPLEPHYDPSIIAKNLQCLLRRPGVSLQGLAQAIAASGEYEPKEYRWLKRLATVGIAQTDKRTLARLEKLASYFTVPLLALRTVRIDQLAVSKELRRYNTPRFLQYGCMLNQLLPDARFEFLKALLETLYLGMDSHFPAGTISPNAEGHQRYILLLFRLLDTGKHEYLKEVITELYGRLTREVAADYEQEATKGPQE